MRIVCPSCEAAYEVPQTRLLPGRMVRCARCATDWAPLAAEPTAEPPPEKPRLEERLARPEPAPPMPEPSPSVLPRPEERLAAPEPPRGDRVLAAAWVLSVVALGAVAWAAYDRREDVIRAWPASERAYAALGMAPRR